MVAVEDLRRKLGDELGAGVLVTAASVAAALQIPKEGRVFTLDAGRSRTMPRHYATPPFEVMTYRTPRGIHRQGDLDYLHPDVNEVNHGFVSDLVIGTTHVGAHIDALCHTTYGERSEWYGGFSADEELGDHGALKCDITKVPAIIARGVMLDIAGLKGVETLEESYAITVDDLEAECRRQDLSIREGDVVLIHTGQMRQWPETSRRADREAGICYEAARYLTDRNIVAIATDNSATEVAPTLIEGNPEPVHLHIAAQRGVYIMEWIYMEELAAADVHEFLFVCLPLVIEGATGSWVRPVAVI